MLNYRHECPSGCFPLLLLLVLFEQGHYPRVLVGTSFIQSRLSLFVLGLDICSSQKELADNLEPHLGMIRKKSGVAASEDEGR